MDEKEEAVDRTQKWGVAPFQYKRLAILYKKDKNYLAEVEILERYAKLRHAPGVKPPRLLERLEKARKLVASKERCITNVFTYWTKIRVLLDSLCSGR